MKRSSTGKKRYPNQPDYHWTAQNWYLRMEKGGARHSGPHWLPYSFTHTCRIDTDRGFMLRAPMSAGQPRWTVSLSLFPFHFFCGSRRNVSREFLRRTDSEPLSSWRGNEGSTRLRVWRFDDDTMVYIYIYTREKKGRKKAEKVEDSVEKLNNQAVRSREGRFITINTLGLMEGGSCIYKFESRVEKEKKKMSFYRVSNSYVFQTSMDPR